MEIARLEQPQGVGFRKALPGDDLVVKVAQSAALDAQVHAFEPVKQLRGGDANGPWRAPGACEQREKPIQWACLKLVPFNGFETRRPAKNVTCAP